VLGGTQGVLGIDIPAVVSGNAISVLGDSSSTGSSFAGSNGAGSSGSGSATTSGEDSTLGGSQVVGDAAVPVTVSGNAISVLGDSSSSSATAAGMSGSGSSPSGTTTGENALLGGTQVVGDAAVPVTVGGNAISVLGDSSTGGGTTGGGDGEDPDQPGEVGGETTTPGATAGVGGAALLAATGSGLQPWLFAVAMLLVAAGATLTARLRFQR
jgi:hypothetical protein